MEERIRRDSLRLHEMQLQLQEMRLKEIMLNAELENAAGRNHKEDSLKRAAQLREIDSLRNVTRGVPVVVKEDTLFRLYASMGGRSPFSHINMPSHTLITKCGGYILFYHFSKSQVLRFH